MQAGDLVAAVELLAQHCLWGRLLQVAASLDAERANKGTALRTAAAAFRSGGQSDTARELFNKLGDYKVYTIYITPSVMHSVVIIAPCFAPDLTSRHKCQHDAAILPFACVQ